MVLNAHNQLLLVQLKLHLISMKEILMYFLATNECFVVICDGRRVGEKKINVKMSNKIYDYGNYGLILLTIIKCSRKFPLFACFMRFRF